MKRATTPHKPALAFLALLSTISLVSCTTIPSHSKPQAIRAYIPAPALGNVPTPKDNQPSDLLLRDFLSASAHPTGTHQAARAFLTKDAATQWKDTVPMVIVERTDIASEGASSADMITYRVSGTVVGTLSDSGIYTPELSAFEAEYRLARVDGQWRIKELPNVVVVERTDFLQHYGLRNVYYMERTGDALVPDPRWIYHGTSSLENVLMSLLGAGPDPRMRGGVRSFLPEGATIRVTHSEGVGVTVDILGVSNLKSETWELLAAQVVWTLAASDIRGPYKILAEGTNPVAHSVDGWQIQNVSQFDPQSEIDEPLRAVSQGAVYQTEGTSAQAVGGWLAGRRVESVSVSPQDTIFAAVMGEGDEQRSLLVGRGDATPQTVIQAGSLTRPSWGHNSSIFYTVADGQRAYRFTRNLATGVLGREEIDMSAVQHLGVSDPRISVFRVSHDGARALMVINGRVYISMLEFAGAQGSAGGAGGSAQGSSSQGAQGGAGGTGQGASAQGIFGQGNTPGTQGTTQGVRLGKPVEIAQQLGDTAVSADWRTDGMIIVGTRTQDAPVWQLTMDGSVSTQLTSRNITAPVVAVAAHRGTIYATDSRALVQFNAGHEGARFWREVPALQGQRAVPVLAY